MIASNNKKTSSSIIGFVDYCDYQRVSGWLIDLSDVNRYLSLSVLIDGIEVCSGVANEYRQDLAANPAFNETCHAYNLNVINHLLDGKEHEIKIIEAETGYVLKNSPSHVIFPKPDDKPKEPRLDLALVGKDGWLFLCNDSNDAIGQYTGKVKLAPDTLEQYKKHYQTIQKFYRSKKIHYLLTIVPGKESIYPEFLPKSVTASNDLSVKDQFISVINSELDIEILDLKPLLIANKSHGQLYYKNDSHWNYLGAMIASKIIISKLREQFPDIPIFNEKFFTLIESNEGQCDLNGKLRLNYIDGQYIENTEQAEQSVAISAISVEYEKKAVEISNHSYAELSRTRPTRLFQNKSAVNLPRAIVIRDSYADWMIPFLSEYFSECLFVWSRSVDASVVESFNPDVVVEQVVDRFLMQNKIKNETVRPIMYGMSSLMPDVPFLSTNDKMEKIVIYIVAPTASGKTISSIRLSKELDATLIHSDTVYDALKEKYNVPVDAARLTVYELWNNPKNFGITSWGEHAHIDQAKCEIYNELLSSITSNLIVIEGFTLSFPEERRMITNALGKHRSIIIRIVMPFEDWSVFYQTKFGTVVRRLDFDKLTNCFAEMEGEEIYVVDNPNKVNADLIKNIGLFTNSFATQQESSMVSFLTKEKYTENVFRTMSCVPPEKNRQYWADYEARWLYHEKAIQILKQHGVASASGVLELGTMGVCLVDGSHTMDYNVNLEHLTKSPEYLHDVRSIPWPIHSNSYEWFIALRVFHHLWPVQRECFEEAVRISRNIILVVPHILPTHHNLGHATAITPSDFREWNCDVAPQVCIPVGDFGFLYAWFKK
jgi:alginate O-acetyltransferase complex protein AlgJ